MIQIKLKVERSEAQAVLKVLDGVVEENTMWIRQEPVGGIFREDMKKENAALRRLRRHLKARLGG